MTLEDLINHTTESFNKPRRDFEMRRYLTKRFVEQGTEKLLSKSIEKRLGGDGEQF
jgi:hypothetical protein